MDHIPNPRLLRSKHPKIATIDVGSNAIRFFVSHYQKGKFYEILHKVRIPLRLGSEVFSRGSLGQTQIQLGVFFFEQFFQLIELYKVETVVAVATSALRDAKNAGVFCDLIQRRTQIQLKTITGLTEAKLIYLAVHTNLNPTSRGSVIFDLGGGSLECIIVKKGGQLAASKSFDLGTVRVMEKMDKLGRRATVKFIKNHIELVTEFLDEHSEDVGERPWLVGTGGNLRRMGKLRRKAFRQKNQNLIHHDEIESLIDLLENLTPIERATEYRMRIDRSEVIVPALMIINKLMKSLGAELMHLPDLSLSDGLIIDHIDDRGIVS